MICAAVMPWILPESETEQRYTIFCELPEGHVEHHQNGPTVWGAVIGGQEHSEHDHKPQVFT